MSAVNARIFEAVLNEVSSARDKFPNDKHRLHALTEECGEVTQAMLNQYHASGKTGYTDKVHEDYNIKVRKELIQTMAMCVRVLTEGDPDFPFSPMQ